MKGDYGVRAMLDLAERYGQGPVQSEAIAKRQEISEAYLDQLLIVLRRAGLVRSLRGPAGGHMLARPPRDLRLGEIVAAMEGPPQTLACSDQRGCRVTPGCVLHEVWSEVESASRAIVDAVTLADLLERQDAGQRRVMYHI